MPNSLLTTKLYFPPARSALVSRPRLLEYLRTGPCGPLTLISAPAGSEKMTLLGERRTHLYSPFLYRTSGKIERGSARMMRMSTDFIEFYPR